MNSGSTLSDQVARRLREEVVEGRLRGGDLMAEAATAQRLGVSRVPVREALFHLHREGLVRFSESGRAFVRTFNEEDFAELLELRLIIEPAAARHAAQHLTEGDEALMWNNLEALENAPTVEKLGSLDLELHTLIVESARLPRLRIIWDQLLPQIEVMLAQGYRQGRLSLQELRPVTLQSQRELVEAIATRDKRKAASVMQAHITHWSEWYVNDLALASKGRQP